MHRAATRERERSGSARRGGRGGRGRALLLAVLAACVLPQGTACDKYEAPPEATIEGLDSDGVLKDPALPVVVRFDRPIQKDTLRLKVAEFITDSEYRLADEPG